MNISNNKDCTYTYHIDLNKYKSILDPLDPVQRAIVDTVTKISDDYAERLKEEMKKLYGSEGN